MKKDDRILVKFGISFFIAFIALIEFLIEYPPAPGVGFPLGIIFGLCGFAIGLIWVTFSETD